MTKPYALIAQDGMSVVSMHTVQEGEAFGR